VTDLSFTIICFLSASDRASRIRGAVSDDTSSLSSTYGVGGSRVAGISIRNSSLSSTGGVGGGRAAGMSIKNCSSSSQFWASTTHLFTFAMTEAEGAPRAATT